VLRVVLRATIYYHPKKIRHIPSIEEEEQPGRAGRKNCLVIGISRASIKRAAAPVFINGPGAWLIESEKIASMINIK
jgi:hypothetical protein